MRSLRRQLFGSHLQVMFVALGVMLAGVIIGAVLFELADGFGPGGRNGPSASDARRSGGPIVLVLALGAAAIAAALVSWRVARRLAAPIEAARGATHQLASGDYGVQVDGGGVAELAELAADINRLGAELDATERRRLQLIGDVAHELRNPLATIEASMEALMDGVVEPTDATFAGIAREAARLRRLAGDLSELSATAEPSAIGRRDPVDVGAVVAHVIDQLAPQAAAKGLELRWSPVGPAAVVGDHDRLVQVFTNVVGNAVQYTEAGSVEVEVETSGRSDGLDGGPAVEVTVADTGRGLTDESRARIFERFHRVDHDSDGTGVGLAIARSLVRAHGGAIEVESAGLGRGSRFTVRLPAAS